MKPQALGLTCGAHDWKKAGIFSYVQVSPILPSMIHKQQWEMIFNTHHVLRVCQVLTKRRSKTSSLHSRVADKDLCSSLSPTFLP